MANDYTLCNQQVTIYHQTGSGAAFSCTRQVFDGAFFDTKQAITLDKTGERMSGSCFVLLPSGIGTRPRFQPSEQYTGLPGCFTVAAHDKIIRGVGPEITTREDWAALLPGRNDGCVVVSSVTVRYRAGQIAHVEVE